MDELEGKRFVLLPVPEVDDKEEYLTDYLESILNVMVDFLTFNPQVPDRVLVTLTDGIDMAQVSHDISEIEFVGQTLAAESPELGNALILTSADVLPKHALTSVKRYLEREYANGEEVISSCFQLPQSKMSAFKFTDVEVMKRVLEHKHHHVSSQEENYEILAEPFFRNFHGHIPIGDIILNDVLDHEDVQGPEDEAVEVPEDVEDPDQNATCRLNTDAVDALPKAIFKEPSTRDSSVEKESAGIPPQGGEHFTYNEEYDISESEWKLIQSKIAHEKVKVNYDRNKAVLSIEGKNIEDIQSFLDTLKGLQSHISHKLESLCENLHILMRSHYANDYLTAQFPDVQWYFQDGTLHLYCFNTSAADQFIRKIKHLKIGFEKAALEKKLSEEDQSLYKKYSDSIDFVEISSDAKETTITGVQKRLMAKLEKPKFSDLGEGDIYNSTRWSDSGIIDRISLEFSDVYYNFLCTHHKEEFNQALKYVASSSINRRGGKAFVQFMGEKQDMKKALAILRLIQYSIEKELLLCLETFTHTGVV